MWSLTPSVVVILLCTCISQTTGTLRTLQCSEQTAPAVAFYAYFSHSFKALSARTTFVFDAVETNIGKGYNRRTGIFTAPSSGVFAFSWTIHAAGSHVAGSSGKYGETAAVIVQNGVAKGSIYADTEKKYDDAASTGFVILHVKRGDRIQIVSPHKGQGAFYSSPDNGRTSFAGYRIA
ncbi:collagen alpha-1(X) chain-like [Ostrea edulis]|uniref:collagen alpha-1(X) chain-like n=1 Tax=Ostrea edulis TaxID=37623 RepID=UPI0024AF6CD7|nr:collagen alpha-1(X) chain-like [Ostrea edulis]